MDVIDLNDLPYTIEDIKRLCERKKIVYKLHATERMIERRISRSDVVKCIMSGEIIEEYIDDKPFPSCLISGNADFPLHVVCSTDNENIFIITVYKPDADIFSNDFKTRRNNT